MIGLLQVGKFLLIAKVYGIATSMVNHLLIATRLAQQ
jgi:hypothetical protein